MDNDNGMDPSCPSPTRRWLVLGLVVSLVEEDSTQGMRLLLVDPSSCVLLCVVSLARSSW